MHQAGGDGEDCVEPFDGSKGDDVGGGFGEGFGAGGNYIDVRQCKGADYFAEECSFLMIGFDQG